MKSKFRAINGNHHAINNNLSSDMLKKKVEEVHGLRITVQENRFEAEEDDDSWNPSPEIKDTSSPLHRITLRGPVVQRSISANPRLNFNLVSLLLFSNAFLG